MRQLPEPADLKENFDFAATARAHSSSNDARPDSMELDQLADWLWCLRTDFVHAYAVREGDGFCLIDTSTAGNDEAILELLGGLAGSAREEVKIVEIFLTHGHSDHTGSAAAIVVRTGARVVAAGGDAPLIRAEQSAPPPQLTDWEVALFEQVVSGVPLEQRLAPAAAVVPDRLVRDGETLEWQRRATLLAVPGHTPGARRSGLRASVYSSRAMRSPRTMAGRSSACSTPTQPQRETAFAVSRAWTRTLRASGTVTRSEPEPTCAWLRSRGR
jgi:hypothetical protein